jgi:hypothetical protein
MRITHTLIDRRCLALHEAVAEKLRRDVRLIDVARDNLRRWTEVNGTLLPALREWQSLLDTRSAEEIVSLLIDPGEEAARLRQSSPFGGILSEDERLAILKRHEPQAA